MSGQQNKYEGSASEPLAHMQTVNKESAMRSMFNVQNVWSLEAMFNQFFAAQRHRL
jgi:hypothetical protein